MNISDTFYNKLELTGPSISWFNIHDKNSEKLSNDIRRILSDGIDFLRALFVLNKEIDFVDKVVVKYKSSKRHVIAFKKFIQIKRSLHQYKALHLETILKTVIKIGNKGNVPSRQVLEWVLVRIQGFIKLFDNICQRCIQVANLVIGKLAKGHEITLLVPLNSIVSRVWLLSVATVKKSSKWYTALLEILPHLKAVSTPWLPEGYEFPENIENWLGNPDYLKQPNIDNTDIACSNESPPGINHAEEKLNANGINEEGEENVHIGENEQSMENVNDGIKASKRRKSKEPTENEEKMPRKKRKSKQPIDNEDILNGEDVPHKKHKSKELVENEEKVPRKKRKSKCSSE